MAAARPVLLAGPGADTELAERSGARPLEDFSHRGRPGEASTQAPSAAPPAPHPADRILAAALTRKQIAWRAGPASDWESWSAGRRVTGTGNGRS